MSSTINVVLLSVFTTTLAIGQLLFKQVSIAIRGMGATDAGAELITHPAFYAALVVYGAATLLWIWILARVSLMQAYPWVAVGVIIVPLLSSHFFGERVAPMFWLGAGLIAVGLVLTQCSRPA